MIGKEPIEEKLEELGRSIGPEDSFAEKVMKRIEAEPDRRLQFKTATFRKIILNRFVKLAIAACVIIAICLFFIRNSPDRKIVTQEISQATDSPAKLTTLASLNIALRAGGMDAVDKQLDKAFKKCGPWPVNSQSQAIQGYSICMHIE